MYVNYREEIDMLRTVIAFVLIAVLAACNTVQGIGKDIKKGGESIEKASK